MVVHGVWWSMVVHGVTWYMLIHGGTWCMVVDGGTWWSPPLGGEAPGAPGVSRIRVAGPGAAALLAHGGTSAPAEQGQKAWGFSDGAGPCAASWRYLPSVLGAQGQKGIGARLVQVLSASA